MNILTFRPGNRKEKKEGKEKEEGVKVPIHSFYFHDSGENLGPLEVKLPLVVTSKLVPNREISELEEILFNEIENYGIDYDVEYFSYGDLHTLMHIVAHQYQPSLLDVLRNKRDLYPYFQENEDCKLSPTDWLTLKFDWSRTIELPDEIKKSLYFQKEAHHILRKVFHSYLSDFQLEIIEEQRKFREAIKESINQNTEIEPGPYFSRIAERKRKLSSALRNLRSKSDSLPGEVLSYLRKIDEIEKQTKAILKDFDPEIEVDLRNLYMQVFPRNFRVFDFEFGPHFSRGSLLTYDIETRSWHSSMTNPTGINSEMCFAGIASEDCNLKGDLVDTHNVVLGIFDIGADSVYSEKLGREFKYIRAKDSDHIRLLSSDFLFSLNPYFAGGHNHDSYDLSRSLNPNRDLAVKAEVESAIQHIKKQNLRKRIFDLFTQGDGMFKVNPDNTEPWYLSTIKKFKEFFGYCASSLDSNTISEKYLSFLTLDNKLESVSHMLNFFSNFPSEYEKVFEGYNDVEESMHQADHDPEQAYKLALYAAEDAATQIRVMYLLKDSMKHIPKILHINPNKVYSSSPGKLAIHFWNKYLFDNFGIVRNQSEQEEISDFEVKESKIKSLEKAFSRTEKELDIKKGGFDNVAVFYTPYFTEGCHDLIQDNEKLSNLYERMMIKKDDMIEDIILQRLMDQLTVEYLFNAKRALAENFRADQFRTHYGLSHKEFLQEFTESMDRIANLFEPDDIINHTGDLIFVKNNATLVERLSENNFHYIGSGSLISVDKEKVIYGIRRRDGISIATSGFKMNSPKKRFSTDNIFQGKNPNFYDNLIYDVVSAYMNNNDLEEVARLLTKGIEERPIQDFFMTIYCGENLEDYTADYRRTLEFMLKKTLNMIKNQKEVIIIEGEGDIITPRIVDTGNPDSWSDYKPNLHYYKKKAFKKTRNLYKLCRVLGVDEYLEIPELEEPEFYINDFGPEQLSFF